jgi:hypothetical protein
MARSTLSPKHVLDRTALNGARHCPYPFIDHCRLTFAMSRSEHCVRKPPRSMAVGVGGFFSRYQRPIAAHILVRQAALTFFASRRCATPVVPS